MIDEMFRARANFYAFLSRMFVEEPPFEMAEDIAGGKFLFPQTSSYNKDFAEGLSLLTNFARTDKDASDIHEKLCREFTRLFVGPVPALFPYESRYIDGSMMARSLLKVKEEYRKAELKRAQGYHEPEDHIAMELGFMSNLCMNGARESLKMQSDFLKDHLSKWAPAFCDELCEKSSNDFYRGIGKITKGFLISEKELLIPRI
ncbi:anaerobic dehydrogenase-like protein [groundwater metagenome]